jgi:hypothetical protein
VITGRVKPEDHKRAKFLAEPLRIRHEQQTNKLPIAALPVYPGEELAVYRVKKRPLVIISIGGDEIPRELCRDKPKWQTYPTILVAPFYGRDESGGRAGFSEEFVKRVRSCEYPHYMWDILPISGTTVESILRLDQIQPLGRAFELCEFCDCCLSEEALIILDEWVQWLVNGQLTAGGPLHTIRECLVTI